MNLLFKTILFSLTLFSATLSQAFITPAAPRVVEISGIKIDKVIQVSSGNKITPLKLNGAGFRNKIFFFRVYVAALYLTEKTHTVKGVLDMPGPKQMNLTMLRTLESDIIKQGINEWVDLNSDQETKEKLSKQFHQFNEVLSLVPDLNKGDLLSLEWVPDVGTNVLVNGKKISKAIPDKAFFNALLRMWIGASPVDRSLKKELLGLPVNETK